MTYGRSQIKTVCKHLFDNQDDLQEADAQHTAERTAVLLHGWQSLLQVWHDDTCVSRRLLNRSGRRWCGGKLVVCDVGQRCTPSYPPSNKAWLWGCFQYKDIPPPPCPSNAYVQATRGVGSVNFCTVDFGGAFFNSLYCVPCVLPEALVLRCMMYIFIVKATLLAERAFGACFASWVSE